MPKYDLLVYPCSKSHLLSYKNSVEQATGVSSNLLAMCNDA